jgi:ornithine cyclodeaminase
MHSTLARSTGKMLVLGERGVGQVLDRNLTEAIAVTQKALISICNGTAVVPSRLGLSYPDNPNRSKQVVTQDWSLIKPAAYYPDEDDTSSSHDNISMGLKVVHPRSNNRSKGLPLTPATIMLWNAETGLTEALLGGHYLTVVRTSAGPAAAVQTWAPECQHVVLFGAGDQAACHIQLFAVALKRPIPKVTIVNRSRANAEKLQVTLPPETQSEVILLEDQDAVHHALSTADVVAATTCATEPLFSDGLALKKGCLITSIGSFTPEMTEIPQSAVDRCHIIIDTPEAMAVGDLKHLGTDYQAAKQPIILAGNAFARPETVTIDQNLDCIFFKTVGTAVQDLLTAKMVVKGAKELGIGQELDMS